MQSKLITTLDNGVLRLTLNYPEKLNCIGFEMLEQLETAMDDARYNHTINLVMISGAGDRSFSTGANLREFQALSEKEARRWIMLGNEVFNKIEKLPKPTLAFINGYAIGGGLELALACDFRFGYKNAFFSSPELKHGWLPGWGGMTRLKRLIGTTKAKEIILLNRELDAQAALELGLLNQVLDTPLELNAILEKIRSLDTEVYALAKLALNDEYRTTEGSDLMYDVLALPKKTGA